MHIYRTYKKWLVGVGLLVAFMMALLATFNYIIDPLWCFTHDHRFSPYQRGFDERQQKTNYLTYVNKEKYDTLILGNSRATLINQNHFLRLHAYNYSLSALTSYEYLEYINYFKKVAGNPGTIIIGFDFQNSNSNLKAKVERPEYYIHNAESPLYRFKVLFTKDVFNHSRNNLRLKKDFLQEKRHPVGDIVYDHNNVTSLTIPTDEPKRQEYIKDEVATLRKTYRNDYTYKENLVTTLKDILQANPGTKFITFTTPVSKPYFCAMVLEGKFPQYERWLKEMVGVFGQVWHFEYLNAITLDYSNNFSDSHHFYAPVGTMIAHRITGEKDVNTPPDFGILLTKDNIDKQLALIKASSVACQ